MNLYAIDFLQHDTAGMKREAAWLTGKLGFEDALFYTESDTAAYGGQFAEARELTRRASESAQRADEKETAAGYEAEAAMRDALVGNMSQAKQQAQAALALSNGRDVEAISALHSDWRVIPASARDWPPTWLKRFPEDTIVQFNYLSTIRAVAALQEGRRRQGNRSACPGCSVRTRFCWPGSDAAYLRGEVDLAEHQGSAAAAEFQKILDHPGVVANEPIGALAHSGPRPRVRAIG